MTTMTRPFQVRPVSEAGFAAEVTGADLSGPMNGPFRKAVLNALHRYKVLIFRDQDITDAQYREFAMLFGPLEPRISRYDRGERFPDLHLMTNVAPDGSLTLGHQEPANRNWHTDKSYMLRPSLTTMLYAIDVPRNGGGTEFADLAAAYEALPAAMRQRIDGMRVRHDWGFAFDGKPGFRKATEEEIRERPSTFHPLARTHPATRRKSLYIGYFAADIEGLPHEQGRALLDELTGHATQPRFIFAHSWRRHDLVMWDNRCLMHRGRPYDATTEPRSLLRAVVQGEVPV
jgi:alpha-ketoglutarate-dependent taurine dioxygenase